MMFRLRFGYLFMVIGLAIVKWPLLPRAHELPPYESVTLCLLTAMSLLALAGLRYRDNHLMPPRLIHITPYDNTWPDQFTLLPRDYLRTHPVVDGWVAQRDW